MSYNYERKLHDHSGCWELTIKNAKPNPCVVVGPYALCVGFMILSILYAWAQVDSILKGTLASNYCSRHAFLSLVDYLFIFWPLVLSTKKKVNVPFCNAKWE